MGVEIGPSISYHQSGGALAASPFLFGFNIESPVQVSQDLLSSTMERVQEAYSIIIIIREPLVWVTHPPTAVVRRRR